MYRDDDIGFDIKYVTSFEQIPEQVYCKLLEDYSDDEIEAYLARDWDLLNMGLADFVECYRSDNYGLTNEEMDSGDQD